MDYDLLEYDDEARLAYKSGYEQGQRSARLLTVLDLCVKGMATIRDAATYLNVDMVDIQECVRILSPAAFTDISEEDIPF